MARHKFRVWCVNRQHYCTGFDMAIRDTGGLFENSDNPTLFDSVDELLVEMCVELFDATGVFVYENDRLLDKHGMNYTVVWQDAGFFARADGDCTPDIPLTQKWLDHWKIQVIGTIHDGEDDE